MLAIEVYLRCEHSGKNEEEEEEVPFCVLAGAGGVAVCCSIFGGGLLRRDDFIDRFALDASKKVDAPTDELT